MATHQRVTGSVNPCGMVVSWTCDKDGEPDEEIECGKPGAFEGGGMFCCVECHATMVKYDADLGRDWKALGT